MKFANFDAARNYIKSHGMLVEYVLSLLIERDVLEVQEDGSLAGMELPERVKGKGGLNVPGSWAAQWPDRSTIEDAMQNPIRFRALLEKLRKQGVRGANHWTLVRCLAYLKKVGAVHTNDDGDLVLGVKSGGTGTVEDFDEAVAEPSLLAGYDEKALISLRTAITEVGPPHDPAKVAERMNAVNLRLFGVDFIVKPEKYPVLAEHIAYILKGGGK